MRRISGDAQTIKYADILDNSREITQQDPQFAPRFLNECRLMLQVMSSGQAALYQQVKDMVYTCLAQLPRRV